MKYLPSLLLILILSGNSLIAQFQTRQTINELYQVDEYTKRQSKGDQFSNLPEYKGSPYHNSEYLQGNVYEGDELMAYEVALRYNAMADEIEIKENLMSEDKDARVLTKDPNIFVKIQNDIFVFVPLNGSIEDGGYFHILYEGVKIDLYKKIIKEFIPGKKASSSLTKDIPPVFEDNSLYFVVSKSGRFYQLPDAKAKKLDIFGSNKEQINAYVRENNLNVSDETDLIKVVKFYDNL